MSETIKDNVNHPSHYTAGEIEVITYIRDKLTSEEFIGYCLGNSLKYISRWHHKGGTEDLEKAQVYLGWAIEASKDVDNAKEIYEKARAKELEIEKEKWGLEGA